MPSLRNCAITGKLGFATPDFFLQCALSSAIGVAA
jgi:hypothetical protein